MSDDLKSDSVTVANINGCDKWLLAARNAYLHIVARMSEATSGN